MGHQLRGHFLSLTTNAPCLFHGAWSLSRWMTRHQKLLGGGTLQRTSQHFAGMQAERCAGRRCKAAGAGVLQGSKSRVRGQEAWLEKSRSEPDGVHECISGCTCSRLESGFHIPKCIHAHLVMSPNLCLSWIFFTYFFFCSAVLLRSLPQLCNQNHITHFLKPECMKPKWYLFINFHGREKHTGGSDGRICSCPGSFALLLEDPYFSHLRFFSSLALNVFFCSLGLTILEVYILQRTVYKNCVAWPHQKPLL